MSIRGSRSLPWFAPVIALALTGWLNPMRLTAEEVPLPLGSGTYLSVTDQLRELLSGKAPATVDELKAIEHQQQQVAARIRACTVSIAIGSSQGSGVIVTQDGIVLTAAHVAIRPGLTCVVRMPDGQQVSGRTWGLNRFVDAGMVKLDGEQAPDGNPWPYATVGLSGEVSDGTWCLATGHPGGYDEQRGAVLRMGRVLFRDNDAIVTDCALISGDSGGPLFDLAGRLVGVHSRIGSDVIDNIHVPIDQYEASWDRLKKGDAWGYLPGFRPVLGVRGRKGSDRAVIDSITADGPGAQAGLKPGDVVVRFADKPIANFGELQKAVEDTMPGERVPMLVERLVDGKQQTLWIKNLRVGRAED
jgi:S1-C subfamily serine protease